jgi:hypothetical protein
MHVKHRDFHAACVLLNQASAGGQVFTSRFTESSEHPTHDRYLIDDGLFESLRESHGEGDSILDIHRVNVRLVMGALKALGDRR